MSDFSTGPQKPLLSPLKLPQQPPAGNQLPPLQPGQPGQPVRPVVGPLKPPAQLFPTLAGLDQAQHKGQTGKTGTALPSFAFSGQLEQKMAKALEVARQEWDKGVRETPGKPNRGKEVDKYAAAVGGIIGETWCGYYLGYCYDKAGLQDTLALASTYRAKKFFSEPHSDRLLLEVGETFNPSKSQYTYSNLPIQPGDVVIFAEKGQSHLGMVEAYNPQTGMLTTLEGNSGGGSAKKGDGSDTEVVRDGNAVVRKLYNLTLKSIRDKFTGFGRPALRDFLS